VLDGRNVDAFDLDLTTTSGEAICASVTTSTVLSSSGAVILTFRDVTAERALEAELRSTKEFLEKLIDSTVDAIVAADTHGNVILFNQGAERIYGYVADEVVGRIPVWELYQEGVAKQVMRMLRSMSYGGVGRLEQTRREILSKSGELVPVNMTASIVYDEDGLEVATVGIFSDLRERIRIEQRLLQAQEKLQVTQKRALVAELAGAAAHELNQPLTSILGYAQLIERQSEPDARHLRAVAVIIRESERMAGIVRKIGRITKFETKEYVGSTSILDLDKSAEATNPSLVLPDPEEGSSCGTADDDPTGPVEIETDASDHSGGREA
jgi:PAS domain S-box-containing protein